MRICTFFGSRYASPVIRPMLRKAIIELIDGDVTMFYAGNNGSFDLNGDRHTDRAEKHISAITV